MDAITLPELREVIHKFKRRRSPGPGEVPMAKIFREMDKELLTLVLVELNTWWREAYQRTNSEQ